MGENGACTIRVRVVWAVFVAMTLTGYQQAMAQFTPGYGGPARSRPEFEAADVDDLMEPSMGMVKEEEGPEPFGLFVIEHAWIEHSARLDFAFADNADGGEFDEAEFKLEVFVPLNDEQRLGFFFEAPFVSLDPVAGSVTEGFGDLEAGFRYRMWTSSDMSDILSVGLGVSIPTGDPDRDLGSGHVALEPGLFWFHYFGEDTYLQAQVLYEVGLDEDEDEEEIHYGLGLARTIQSTKCPCRVIRNITPIIEVNGVSAVAGDESGETAVDLTPGVRWIIGRVQRGADPHSGYNAGVALRIPVTGDKPFDGQFIFSVNRHF